MNAPDSALLDEFVSEGSEAAFAELLRRHVDLVHSAALRQTGGDAQAAEDVAQAVFIAFARKARRLRGRGSLAGWFYTGTRLAAAPKPAGSPVKPPPTPSTPCPTPRRPNPTGKASAPYWTRPCTTWARPNARRCCSGTSSSGPGRRLVPGLA